MRNRGAPLSRALLLGISLTSAQACRRILPTHPGLYGVYRDSIGFYEGYIGAYSDYKWFYRDSIGFYLGFIRVYSDYKGFYRDSIGFYRVI